MLTTADRRQAGQKIAQDTDNVTELTGKTLMFNNI